MFNIIICIIRQHTAPRKNGTTYIVQACKSILSFPAFRDLLNWKKQLIVFQFYTKPSHPIQQLVLKEFN